MADIPSTICISVLLLHTFYGLVITEISIPPQSCIVSDINSPVNIFFRTENDPEFRGPIDCNTDEPKKALIASGKCQTNNSYECNVQERKACSITIKQSQCGDAGTYVAQDNNGFGYKAFSEIVLRGNHTSPHNSSHYQVAWQVCGNAQLTITCRPTTGQTTSTVCHTQPGTNCTYLSPYQSNATCFMELTIFNKCEHKNSTINWTAIVFHNESRTFASTSPVPDHTHTQTSTTVAQPTAFVNVGTTIGFVLVGLGAAAIIIVVLLICRRRYCRRHNNICTAPQEPVGINDGGVGSHSPLNPVPNDDQPHESQGDTQCDTQLQDLNT